ncbi:phage baseplate protein [Mannheimia granulomatis]|uniref:Phage baseplate protein n=1 Tax=Mannheimia granulomatis TaxID=85402 RepID=A0A011LYC8_9PAST|nr:phage baseplate assembly protein V [Mannheimia granulomatis]EXI62233.1 phage baseplate protein [Mannheimia granulomatis]QIM66325.1 phage baseplate protein [Mannheimia granulomatis]RGE47414.1 phage baseplate protein [Mannheimia granulomatis]
MNTHNFSATYQEGIVSQIDPKTHRIKATIPALEDFETAWLPFFTINAGGNHFYGLPDVGELVAMILDARGESGYVLGTIYNEQDPVPVADSDMWLHKFKNGTVISHDRKTGDVVVNTNGHLTATAKGGATINANTVVNGTLHATGKITSDEEVSAPVVKQGSVELGTHKHGGGPEPNK